MLISDIQFGVECKYVSHLGIPSLDDRNVKFGIPNVGQTFRDSKFRGKKRQILYYRRRSDV